MTRKTKQPQRIKLGTLQSDDKDITAYFHTGDLDRPEYIEIEGTDGEQSFYKHEKGLLYEYGRWGLEMLVMKVRVDKQVQERLMAFFPKWDDWGLWKE